MAKEHPEKRDNPSENAKDPAGRAAVPEEKSNRPIGLFDSGVGGLTVAHALHSMLPSEQLIYFGDTAHLPYGDKSKETILQYSLGITDFLLEQNCKVILIACNSASSNAFEEVRATASDGLSRMSS